MVIMVTRRYQMRFDNLIEFVCLFEIVLPLLLESSGDCGGFVVTVGFFGLTSIIFHH